MRSLPKLLIGISIFGMVFGFLNLFLFQTTFGVLDIDQSSISTTFHLKEGYYSINAVGENQAFGFSSGELSLLSIDGSGAFSPISISFSFDGESSFSAIMLASVKIEKEGDYYLQYNEFQSNTIGMVKITLQQSFIAGLFGITEFTFVFYSTGVLISSIILATIWSFSSRDRSVPPDYPSEPVQREDRGDFVFDDSPSYPKSSRLIECPLCGTRSDGLFCEKCGTNLR
ncbi:MAG: hypothetical protein ACFFE8_05110 [Candidatus Heimdallarchaeota archaeon]